MKIMEIGKLEVYINAGQEARVPTRHRQGKTVAAGGPRADIYGSRPRPVYAATPSAVAEVVLPCPDDSAQPCCGNINSGD
jgi:hypothetical protein